MEIQQIKVAGIHKDAVAAMQEFINQIQGVSVHSNPFSDAKYQVNINVDGVTDGSAFLRYMLLSAVGRPTVTVSFSFVENNRRIAEGTFTSSAFFQDSRDVGFRGGAFGGSNLSFIRTNSRILVKRIVQAVVASIDMSQDEAKQLIAALDERTRHVTTLKWMAVSATIGALLIGFLTLVAKERFTAVWSGSLVGALFGGLIGLALAGIIRLFHKLVRGGRKLFDRIR